MAHHYRSQRIDVRVKKALGENGQILLRARHPHP
jgi:hypothetical protein